MNAWSGVVKSAIVWYDGSMDTYGMSDETIIIGMLLLVCPLCLIPPLASGNLLYIVVASGIMVLSIFGGIAIIRYCARKRAVRVKDLARDPWIETEQNELGEQRYAVCVYELKSETNHYTHGSDTTAVYGITAVRVVIRFRL